MDDPFALSSPPLPFSGTQAQPLVTPRRMSGSGHAGSAGGPAPCRQIAESFTRTHAFNAFTSLMSIRQTLARS